MAYGVFGDPSGTPVVYCHGFPGSRLDGALVEASARAVGIRLIAPDRPGFGHSTFQPGRTMDDWPRDLGCLADHLDLGPFTLLGVSGGGPYALVAAIALGERIRRLGLVCALGSLADPASTAAMGGAQALMIDLVRRYPGPAHWMDRWLTGPIMGTFPALSFRILAAAAPPADRDTLSDPEVRQRLLATTHEAFRQGGSGPAWELYLFTHRWTVDASRVPTDTRLWHGEADRTLPVAMGRRYAALIPRCRARFLPAEGHFSLAIRRAPEILSDLIGP